MKLLVILLTLNVAYGANPKELADGINLFENQLRALSTGKKIPEEQKISNINLSLSDKLRDVKTGKALHESKITFRVLLPATLFKNCKLNDKSSEFNCSWNDSVFVKVSRAELPEIDQGAIKLSDQYVMMRYRTPTAVLSGSKNLCQISSSNEYCVFKAPNIGTAAKLVFLVRPLMVSIPFSFEVWGSVGSDLDSVAKLFNLLVQGGFMFLKTDEKGNESFIPLR